MIGPGEIRSTGMAKLRLLWHVLAVAAAKATETIYGRKPDLTREGGSIPVTLTFTEALQKNVMLLPMGRGDDGA